MKKKHEVFGEICQQQLILEKQQLNFIKQKSIADRNKQNKHGENGELRQQLLAQNTSTEECIQ